MGRREINDFNNWRPSEKLWRFRGRNFEQFSLEYDIRLGRLTDRLTFLIPSGWELGFVNFDQLPEDHRHLATDFAYLKDESWLHFVATKDDQTAGLSLNVFSGKNYLPETITLVQKFGSGSLNEQFSVWDNELLLLQFTGNYFAAKTGTRTNIIRAGLKIRRPEPDLSKA